MSDISSAAPYARFRHTSFLDLLADAAHSHLRARKETEPYEISRAARTSIVASCLSIECFANCMIHGLGVSTGLERELDKMPPLSKIDLALRLGGKEPLDRGARPVQQANELLKLRNEYVHPKIEVTDADIKPFERTEQEVVLPFTVTATFWPMLQVAKQAFLWDSNASQRVLLALSDLYRYVLHTRCDASEEDILRLFLPRFEIAHVLMPAVYGEYTRDINALNSDGIDFSFLNL
jgi:hypothetical protein